MTSEINIDIKKSNTSPNETQLRVLRHTNKFLKLFYLNRPTSAIYKSFSRRIISKIVSVLPQWHPKRKLKKNESIIIDKMLNDIKSLDKT
jgi:uncharacterized protein with ATP-grasp and redox domains